MDDVVHSNEPVLEGLRHKLSGQLCHSKRLSAFINALARL